MKISVNDVELFQLSATQIKVIENDIPSEKCHEDLCQRLKYILMHKYEQCHERLKKEWDKKLVANGVTSVPTDPEAYAQLVFAQPNYKNRSQREAENAANKQI